VIEATIQQGVQKDIPVPEARNPELVRCFRHEDEGCPRCGGSGHRPRGHCARCAEPTGRPSQGGKALMGLRNCRGRDQASYYLDCHPELSSGELAVLEGVGG
jgi:hypothetical protein